MGKSYRKSIGTVTKLGANQRSVLQKLGYRVQTFTELLRSTGLSTAQLKSAVDSLRAAKVIEYVWAKDGRAVFELVKEGE